MNKGLAQLSADSERLRKQNDVLDLYLHDTLLGVKPSAKVRYGGWMALLFRPLGGHGGYVALVEKKYRNSKIYFLEDAIKAHSVYSSGDVMNILLERVRVARNKLIAETEQAAG